MSGSESAEPIGWPSGRFRCIVADPPWEYHEGFMDNSHWQLPDGTHAWTKRVHDKPLPYQSMTVEQIAAMPVSVVAAKDCRLWLWTTNRYLPAAFRVLAEWGFVYRQTFVWHKSDANIGGSLAPNSAEFLLVGVRGNPRRLARLKASVWKFPQAKRHSRKPEAWQSMIETVCEGPRLELFARRKRDGWTVWGNEV